jgi:hypothetical protein
MSRKDEQEILSQALEACAEPAKLRFCPIKPSLQHADQDVDGLMRAQHRAAKQDYAVRIRPVLHTAAITNLAELARGRQRPLLLVTTRVSAGQGRALRDAGVQFMDTAGNCYLEFPGFHLFVLGQKGAEPVVLRPHRPSFSAAEVRLIFHYMTDPKLTDDPRNALINRTYREVSEASGVSLGSVTSTRAALNALGFLNETSEGLSLVNRRDLMERWVSAYTTRLRPKFTVSRYRAPHPDWWTQVALDPKTALWGGEPAAQRLTRYLKPEIITIYRLGNMSPFILEHDLRVDREGKVEILDAFWSSPDIRKGDCVHPLLVYADLIASGIDRDIEAARVLHDQYLRSFVETH